MRLTGDGVVPKTSGLATAYEPDRRVTTTSGNRPRPCQVETEETVTVTDAEPATRQKNPSSRIRVKWFESTRDVAGDGTYVYYEVAIEDIRPNDNLADAVRQSRLPAPPGGLVEANRGAEYSTTSDRHLPTSIEDLNRRFKSPLQACPNCSAPDR